MSQTTSLGPSVMVRSRTEGREGAVSAPSVTLREPNFRLRKQIWLGVVSTELDMPVRAALRAKSCYVCAVGQSLVCMETLAIVRCLARTNPGVNRLSYGYGADGKRVGTEPWSSELGQRLMVPRLL
jgi:hypothetical protein